MFSFFKRLSDDTKVLPLGVKLVILTLFLRSFGWGFVDPFFSIFVDGFSQSYAGVGSLISIMNLTSLVAILPLMRLADRMRDTAIMRDSEVLYMVCIAFYLLAAFTGEVTYLIVAFILNGVALPLMIVGAETYIRKYASPFSETKSFAFYTAFNYLGWILGMFVGAFTVQYYGLKSMFLFVLPGSFLGLLVLRHIHEKGLKSLIWGIRRYFHNGHDLSVIYEDLRKLNPKSVFFLVLSFFDGIIVMFTYVFIPLFAVSMNLSLKLVALLVAVMYLPFVFSFVISELTEKLKHMEVIAMGLMVGAVSFALLAFILDSLWVAVLAMMTTVSLAIIRPAYNGMLTRLTPRKNLGEVTGVNNLALRLGFVVGPIITGFVADVYSIQVSFFLIAFFAFLLAVFALLFKGLETWQTNS